MVKGNLSIVVSNDLLFFFLILDLYKTKPIRKQPRTNKIIVVIKY